MRGCPERSDGAHCSVVVAWRARAAHLFVEILAQFLVALQGFDATANQINLLCRGERDVLPRAGDAFRSSQKSTEDSRFKVRGSLPAWAEALRLVAAERWERDPEGPGKLSTSTSVDSVHGPGLPRAPDALL